MIYTIFTGRRNSWHILRYHWDLTSDEFCHVSSLEGDEVFWVGLVIVEDHKHGGRLLVVHHTVKAVGGVRASRRWGLHGRATDGVTAGQDTSDIHSP